MYKLISSDMNLFKSSFGAISQLVNEVQMEIDSDGIRLNAIDSSHVTFVHLELKKDSFDVYECSQPTKITFDSDEFLKFLKRGGKDSILELTNETNNLIVHFEGNVNKTFKLRLIDSEYDTPPLPELDYAVEMPFTTSLLKEIISDIVLFSQKLRINANNNVIKFEAFGDFADVEIECEHGQDIQDDVSAIYDIEKIKEMLKADKFSKNCTISFGNNMPLKVELKSDDETESLEFLLAPRIEEEF